MTRFIIAERQPVGEKPPIDVNAEVIDEMNDLAPGQAVKLTLADGREFGLMHWDDLMHLAEKAQLRLKGDADQTTEGQS